MKKLLTVLCVAACGIGAAAQAQKNVSGQMVKYDLVSGMDQKITKDAIWPEQEGARLMQSEGDFDTLYWHPEYTNENCNGYYSLMIFGDFNSTADMYTADYVASPFGASYNGTGEVGATYQTANNEYLTYAGRDLSNAMVVGAWGIAYRANAPSVWERVDISGFDSVTDVNGVLVPQMPYKLKGYPIVESQTAVGSYYEAFFGSKEVKDISIVMPLSKEDATETAVGYLPYLGSRFLDDGRTWPLMSQVGGMFEEAFPAGNNFGLSMEAQLTGDQTYDSLWSWSLIAKSNQYCTFVDAWSSWQRVDFSNNEKSWVWLWKNDGSDIDVSKPLETEDDDWGFAPTGCPQHDNGTSLYVYAFSLSLMLSSGSHYMPFLYPIVQYGEAANEKDTYAQTVSVYPLPATDKVTVVALDPIRKVEIYNMAGALLKSVAMNDNVLEFDVTSYAPGTYIAKITTDKGVASKKLVVR